MSSSSVISRVTRSASALTVSSISRFWSSLKRSHLASRVAVKPLTLVSGERSSWATVETSSARLSSSRARCRVPRMRHDAPGGPGRAARRGRSATVTSTSWPPGRSRLRSGWPVTLRRPSYGSAHGHQARPSRPSSGSAVGRGPCRARPGHVDAGDPLRGRVEHDDGAASRRPRPGRRAGRRRRRRRPATGWPGARLSPAPTATAPRAHAASLATALDENCSPDDGSVRTSRWLVATNSGEPGRLVRPSLVAYVPCGRTTGGQP